MMNKVLSTLLLALHFLAAMANAQQTSTNNAATKPSASQMAGGNSSVSEVEAQINSNQVDAALTTLTALFAANAGDVRVRYLLGLAYYQKNDFPHVVEHLSAAILQLPPGSQQHHQSAQLLGLSHYFLGHMNEAIPHLEEARMASPENNEIAYVLGNAYIQTHQPEKSREIFARMFSVKSDSAAAYLLNAQMMVRTQFEELAEKELTRALEIDSKFPQANFMLGELAIFHADIDRGIALIRKEIVVNPGYAMAYYRLGEALTRQLKWDEAIAPLQKSIWLNPYFSGPFIVLGKVYLKKQDAGNAESILRRAIAMDPNNYSAHHLLAQVYQQTKRADDARKEFAIAERLRGSGSN